MTTRISWARLAQIWRYYQAGLLNAAFGFGLFALFVRLGFNLYVAQIVAHILGATFNYITYSRHVFRDSGPAKRRFAASYAVNYVISLVTLAGADCVVSSHYLAGFISLVLTSLINYFVLKHLVFQSPVAR